MSTILEFIEVLKVAEGKLAEKKAKKTTPKGTCFHYGQVGHWKMNYKAYLESKKKVACDAPSSLGIYVIKVNIVSSYNTWVYDTDSCHSRCSGINKIYILNSFYCHSKATAI